MLPRKSGDPAGHIPSRDKMSNPGPSKEALALADCIAQYTAIDQRDYPSVARDIDQHTAALRSRAEQAEARVAELEAKNARHKRWHPRSTHGPCCTCSSCGLNYDDCRCSLDEVADEVDSLRARLAKADELAEAVEKHAARFPTVPSGSETGRNLMAALAAYRKESA